MRAGESRDWTKDQERENTMNEIRQFILGRSERERYLNWAAALMLACMIGSTLGSMAYFAAWVLDANKPTEPGGSLFWAVALFVFGVAYTGMFQLIEYLRERWLDDKGRPKKAESGG